MQQDAEIQDSCPIALWAFRKRLYKDAPPQATMQKLFYNMQNQGCVCKKKDSGHPLWVRRLSGRRRQFLINIQRNLCRREAISYRCWNQLRGMFFADGFMWNLTTLLNVTLPNHWIGRRNWNLTPRSIGLMRQQHTLVSVLTLERPPLWFSGQTSWLHT
jgi:hypothetical protein